MRLTIKIFKILIIIEALLFIMLAMDSFDLDLTVFERVIGFLISIIPGAVLILIIYFLWQKEKIMGYILTPIAIFMVFFFGVFKEMPESLLTLIIIGPALIGGILFIIYGENKEKEE